MQIDSGQLSFAVPPGLEDHTLYAFNKQGSKESLVVSFGLLSEPGGMPAVISDNMQEIQTILGSPAPPPQGPTQVHGLATWWVGFTVEENTKKLGQRWAWIQMNPTQYAQLMYTATSEKKAASDFEHILHSVSPSSTDGAGGTSVGYKRWHIGQISLDVPSDLQPPRMYELESPDGQTRLKLVVYDAAHGDSPPRSIEQQISAEVEEGKSVSDKQVSTFAVNDGFGRVVSYWAKTVGEEPRAVRRVQLSFQNGVSVIVEASSPQPLASSLETTVSNLLGSVHLVR